MAPSQDENYEHKEIASESFKTKRAREKLIKRFEFLDTQITQEAVEKKTVEIHRWISRHADRRISLKNKSICLFDENKNAEEISPKIHKIVEKIQKERLSE